MSHRLYSLLLSAVFAFTLLNTVSLQAQTAASQALPGVLTANAQIASSVNSGAGMTAQLRQMLTDRHATLAQVMRSAPASTRSFALDPATRAALLALDPANAALVEQDTPLTGEFGLAIADDFTNHTATNHYFLHTPVGDRAISFVNDAVDHTMLVHHHVTVTGLSIPEVVAVETIREASQADVETCLAPLAEARTNTLMSVRASAATIPTGSATPLCSTVGNQTTAIILLKFAGSTLTLPTGLDQPAYWQNLFTGPTPSVNDFLKDTSYGQTSLSADVFGPITIPGSYDCNTTDGMATAAFAAVQGMVDFTSYNRYVLVYPAATCAFAGLGAFPVGASTTIPHQYTIMWVPELPGYSPTNPPNFFTNVSHEFGHNLGLNHSNSLDFGTQMLGPLDFSSNNPGTVRALPPAPEVQTSSSSASMPQANGASTNAAAAPSGSTNVTAVNTEYGDNLAMMGYAWAPAGGYAAMHRYKKLGWLNAASEQDITASGNFSLAPIEATTGLRALHVLRDATSNSWIWIEYQQPLGIYEPLSLAGLPTNSYTNGAVLRYESPLGANYTYLLDYAATAQPNNFFLGNLVQGSTWSDPYSLLTITSGTQTATALPVTISYDTPCATVAVSSSTLATAGGTATVNITAPSTCTWSVASNANWISFPGATTGTGNATVTFNYAANTTGTQRNSYITAQRQSLPVVQMSGNVTVLLSSTPTINVAPGAEIPISFSVSDEAGIADLLQFGFNVAGSGGIQDCSIGLQNNTGTTSSLNAFLFNNLQGGPVVQTGTGTPQTISACTFDTANSSFAINGNVATVTLALSFPAGFSGVHAIQVTAQNAAGSLANANVGFVDVSTTAAGTRTVLMNPTSGTQGTTVPINFIGAATAFSAGSTVTVSGTGITVSGVTFTSATSLAATLNIATNAAPGPYTVTITSGTEVDTATFTVNAIVVPTATLVPSSGAQGTTVPFVITSNVPFTTAVGDSVSGNGVTLQNFQFQSQTSITGSFVIAANADLGPHTVSLTSTAVNENVTFTVNPGTTPSIAISPTSAVTGATVPITITGTNTNFTAGSTIMASDPTITFSNITFVSSTSLTATMNIATNSTAQVDTITVVSGTEVDNVPFSVNAALIASFTTTPASGGTGTNNFPIRINGLNTSFSIASQVTVSGTGVTLSNINTEGTGLMYGNISIAANATPGPYTITITTGKASCAHTFMVMAGIQTTSTVSASSASLLPTQNLSLSAQVTPVSGTTKPTGIVSFVEIPAAAAPVTLASVSLNAGAASYSIAKPSIGIHTYDVSYLGDGAGFDPSASSTITVTVAQATPALALSGVPTGVLYPAASSNLIFTAALTSSAGVTPTGSVVFKDGSTTIGTVTAANGTATLTGVSLATGTHSITATYGGDANFVTVTTAAQTVAVQDFALAPGANSITALGTTSLTVPITISPGAGGFTQAIALTCTGAPANSNCLVLPSSLTPGTVNATAMITIQTVARPGLAHRTGGAALLLFAAGSGWLLRRRRSALRLLCWLVFLAGGASLIGGCSSPVVIPGTAAGTYTLTITGTAAGTATLVHTSTVTLIVQ
jgi:hypothetical protein